MVFWLIVVAIFAILGLTGYYKGAMRASVSLAGLLIATFLALPLSPLLKPLIPKLGLAHPIWPVVVPPLVIFLVIALLFVGVSFVVHRKTALHFKYATDDYTRLRWERLNQRLGLCIGLLGGAIYSILVGLIIYIFGYPIVQVTGPESPTIQRLLSSARKDVSSSGLDRTLAAIDPMPDYYYLTSDILGLLYQNYSALQPRLVNYPPFLSLGERPEFKEIASDNELLNLLQSRGSVVEILKHPKIVALLNNAEIMGQLEQLDKKDLYQYLKTGRSEKYAEERILGWWQLDPYATFIAARKKNPDMPAKQMAELKQMLMVWIPELKFMAAPDNKMVFRYELGEAARQMIASMRQAMEAAQAAAAAQQQSPVPQMSPEMARRYGLIPRGGAGAGGGAAAGGEGGDSAAAPAATPDLPGVPQVKFVGDGTWQRKGSRYEITFQDPKGQSHTAEAKLEDDRLLISSEGQTMIFYKVFIES